MFSSTTGVYSLINFDIIVMSRKVNRILICLTRQLAPFKIIDRRQKANRVCAVRPRNSMVLFYFSIEDHINIKGYI